MKPFRSIVLLTLVQAAIGAHGWLAHLDRLNQPLGLRAGVLVARESRDGSWLAVDAALGGHRAGDRLQVEVIVDEPLRMRLLVVTADAAVPYQLFPLRGERPPLLTPDERYTLPSPSSWYETDTAGPGGRLVLVAERPGGDADLAGLRDWLGDGSIAGRRSGAVVERVEVPLPDGGTGHIELYRAAGRPPLVAVLD